jgi:CheY-like chemotaxis protein
MTSRSRSAFRPRTCRRASYNSVAPRPGLVSGRSRVGLEAGADDFLNKPIDHEELQTRVRSLMRLNPPPTR